jgi:cytochrome c
MQFNWLPMKPRYALLAAALIALPLPAQTPRAPVGDAAQGQRQFIQCRACHSVIAGGAHSVGPNLFGVIGAKAASKPGFAYSPALARSGITWTSTELDAYIARPAQKVPGTKMVFGGVPAAASRQNLIAYLTTLKKR